MSDFSKVTINGTSYNVKDATARSAAETNAEAISELNGNSQWVDITDELTWHENTARCLARYNPFTKEVWIFQSIDSAENLAYIITDIPEKYMPDTSDWTENYSIIASGITSSVLDITSSTVYRGCDFRIYNDNSIVVTFPLNQTHYRIRVNLRWIAGDPMFTYILNS